MKVRSLGIGAVLLAMVGIVVWVPLAMAQATRVVPARITRAVDETNLVARGQLPHARFAD